MNDILDELRPRGQQLSPEMKSTLLAAILSEPRRPGVTLSRSLLVAAASLVVLGGTALAVVSFSDNEDGPPGGTVAECTPRVRMDGMVYEASTYIEDDKAARFGSADLSACDDSGSSPAGAYFPADPDVVGVWALDGQDPERVVGVRMSNGTFAVYVALELAAKERRAIVDRLESAHPDG